MLLEELKDSEVKVLYDWLVDCKEKQINLISEMCALGTTTNEALAREASVLGNIQKAYNEVSMRTKMNDPIDA